MSQKSTSVIVTSKSTTWTTIGTSPNSPSKAVTAPSAMLSWTAENWPNGAISKFVSIFWLTMTTKRDWPAAFFARSATPRFTAWNTFRIGLLRLSLISLATQEV